MKVSMWYSPTGSPRLDLLADMLSLTETGCVRWEELCPREHAWTFAACTRRRFELPGRGGLLKNPFVDALAFLRFIGSRCTCELVL